MSLATALSNAISGLGATSRGTQVVSDNLSNIKTEGFARRELKQTAISYAGAGGGVRVDGIARVVNTALLAEFRSAGASATEADIRTVFFQKMEKLVGLPGDPQGLSYKLNEFRESLINANAQPDDTVRLSNVVNAAQNITQRLNHAAVEVQGHRRRADAAIRMDVQSLNDGLEQVAQLNRRIAIIDSIGKDPSALMDRRQLVLDKINKIIPLHVAQREASRVDIYTVSGATLLNGTKPVSISFTPTTYIDSQTNEGERLYVNGREITENGMKFFAGGSLSANFEVRDKLTTQMQRELDSFALELHNRFSNAQTDPTLGDNKAGLFTDGDSKASADNILGLSSRISLNPKISPQKTDKLWLLRSGMGATVEAPAGDTTQLARFHQALTKYYPPTNKSVFSEGGSLLNQLSELESHVSGRRVEAEEISAARNARMAMVSTRFLADGVDTDAELQQLLQYEQAYAANARVVQTIRDMMDEILRW